MWVFGLLIVTTDVVSGLTERLSGAGLRGRRDVMMLLPVELTVLTILMLGEVTPGYSPYTLTDTR